MTEFFFPDNKCGIGGKVEKPVFKFVADCNIEPTPRPIFDCPLPIITREPEIPCPEFNVKSKLDVGFGSTPDKTINNCDVQNKLKFEIKKKVDDSCPAKSNSCEFDVDLEVAIRIPAPPCPIIKVSTFNVKSGYADQPCVEDESRFEIRSRTIPGENCDDPGSCEFDVDLEIVVPIPRPPCPEITVNTFSVVSDYSDGCATGQNRFEITTRHRQPTSCDDPGDCKFDVDLELYIPLPRPPCPEIRVAGFSVTVDYPICVPAGATGPCTGGNKFSITKTPKPVNCGDLTPEGCDFDVTLEINIPAPKIPCPKLNIKNFEVKSDYVQCLSGSGSSFIITPRVIPCTCDELERCEFDFEITIEVPIPDPPCPEITGSLKINYVPLPPNITPPASCNVFRITKTTNPPACVGDGDGGSATGPTGPTGPSNCEFDLEIEICVPVPQITCPTFNIKTFKVETKYQDCLLNNQNKFVITQAPQSDGGCDFDIELEINIPIPRTPCPVFGTSLFLNTFLQGCGTPGGVFEVTPEPIPGDCDTPEQCVFYFDLALNIPLPRFVSEIAITTNKPVINVEWCPGIPAISTASLIFRRQADLFAGACDRGSLAWFNAELEIDIKLPPVPCITMTPTADQFIVNRVKVGDEFIKLTITPEQRLGCDPCSYTFGLDVQLLEPCELVFHQSPVKINYSDTPVPPSFISISQRVPFICEFDIDLTLNLQKTCVPTFNIVPPGINPCYYTDAAQFDACIQDINQEFIRVEILPSGNDDCNYNVHVYAKPPIYIPPLCDTFNFAPVKIQETTGPNRGTLTIVAVSTPTPEANYCEYEGQLNLYLRQACVPNFTTLPIVYNPCSYSDKAGYDACNTAADDTFIRVDILPSGNDDCNYNVQVYAKPPVYVPGASACAEFIDYGVLIDKAETNSGTITITPRPLTDSDTYCTYDVKLELKLKECVPNFTTLPIVYNPCTYTDEAQFNACNQAATDTFIRVEILPSGNDDCNYNVQVYAKPPVYVPTATNNCPDIWYSPGSLNVVPVAWAPVYEVPALTFTPEITDGKCRIEVAGSIYVPKSKITVGTVNASFITCGSDPKLEIEISPPDNNCNQVLTAKLFIPQPPEYVGTAWTISGGLGTAASTVATTGCSRTIGGTITLSTTTCPLPMTAMPMMDGPAAKAGEADVIMTLWDQPEFVDGFITALETNERLRNNIKALLKE